MKQLVRAYYICLHVKNLGITTYFSFNEYTCICLIISLNNLNKRTEDSKDFNSQVMEDKFNNTSRRQIQIQAVNFLSKS